MKHFMIGPFVLAGVLVGAFAAPARADECDKLTYLTFSAPVALPGVTLPAGTYRFSHPDCSDHVLRVSSQDGLEVFATLLAIPDTRPAATAEPVVVFEEMRSGAPEGIKAWFYPGETTGDELIYPKDALRNIADAT